MVFVINLIIAHVLRHIPGLGVSFMHVTELLRPILLLVVRMEHVYHPTNVHVQLTTLDNFAESINALEPSIMTLLFVLDMVTAAVQTIAIA